MSSSKRIFTYEEALALLPDVRKLTGDAVASVEGSGAGEADENAAEQLDLVARRIVEEWARSIMDMGIEVKGLWLVDFDSGSGYYCWRYPEESLEYFHGYDEGFAGRVKLN